MSLSAHKSPVILLGGSAIALSVARTLGSRGIRLFAVDGPKSYVQYSRFSTWVDLSYEHGLQRGWLSWLTTDARETLRGALLFPCCDDGLELLARHGQDLADDYILPEMNGQVTLSLLDKLQTAELARQAGVASPKVWNVTSSEEVQRILPEMTYPCTLKPRHSHKFARVFPDRKLFIAKNEAELLGAFLAVSKYELQMCIQEIIPGPEDEFYSYYTYLDENGKPLFYYTKRKLRQHPNNFGQWTYHCSGWYPEAADVGLWLFQEIGLRGIGTAEFKRDARDGKLKLIECNPRFTLAIELLRYSGIEWAQLV